MIIKKFIGKTESEATEAAKKELGEGVVIMNVKFVKAQGPFAFLKKKQVEVTVALEDDEEPIRQIRKIAQAQVDAQAKNAGAKNAASKPEEVKSSFSVKVDDSTELKSTKDEKASKAAAAIAEAGSRTGISPSATEKNQAKATDTNVIEAKLDNLQSLLETQISRENAVLDASAKAVKKADTAISKDDDKEDEKEEQVSEKAQELDEQDKEIDRFLRLLYNTMIDNEIDEHFANELIGDAEKNRKPGVTMDFVLSTIYQKMILKFGKSDGITPAVKNPKLVFFIGPTGVGKTTTIAKVASSFSVNEKKKVALLTTDTYRIAATDQLRTYAGILAVPFRVIYEPDELAAAVLDFADCDYIFIDSAGHSHKNGELLRKQRDFLDAVSENEKQIFLVLSATTKYKDLKKIADNYTEISDYQLIFTKLDETGEYGNLYNMKCVTGAPIAYVTYGQNVPDDIESFGTQKTVKQLLGGKNNIVAEEI